MESEKTTAIDISEPDYLADRVLDWCARKNVAIVKFVRILEQRLEERAASVAREASGGDAVNPYPKPPARR
jgi:3-deoxy-D-manno-octulosonate 8-phosphate phosphatase KdsC-like HAD superfamily phosphatase